MGFPGGSGCKVSACNVGDLGSNPGSGKSPGGGYDNPLQYSLMRWFSPYIDSNQSLMSLALAGGFFTTSTTWEAVECWEDKIRTHLASGAGPMPPFCLFVFPVLTATSSPRAQTPQARGVHPCACARRSLLAPRLKDLCLQGCVSSGCHQSSFKMGNDLTIFVVATINPLGVTSNGTNFKFHP